MGEGSFCLVLAKPSASAGVGFSGSALGPAQQHEHMVSRQQLDMRALMQVHAEEMNDNTGSRRQGQDGLLHALSLQTRHRCLCSCLICSKTAACRHEHRTSGPPLKEQLLK